MRAGNFFWYNYHTYTSSRIFDEALSRNASKNKDQVVISQSDALEIGTEASITARQSHTALFDMKRENINSGQYLKDFSALQKRANS